MLNGIFVHRGPAQPDLLHDVLGLGARTEHAVAQRTQTARIFTVVAQGALGKSRHDGYFFGTTRFLQTEQRDRL